MHLRPVRRDSHFGFFYRFVGRTSESDLSSEESAERQRRIDAAIEAASASYMSDSKWRKVFTALSELSVGPIRWKFVRDDKIYVERVPLFWFSGNVTSGLSG